MRHCDRNDSVMRQNTYPLSPRVGFLTFCRICGTPISFRDRAELEGLEERRENLKVYFFGSQDFRDLSLQIL